MPEDKGIKNKGKSKNKGHTYWSEELWSGDGWTVTVEFNSTAQIKIADLHRWNLQNAHKRENQTWTFAQKWWNTICRHASCVFTLWLETLKPQTLLLSRLNHECKVYFECVCECKTYPVLTFTQDVFRLQVSVGHTCKSTNESHVSFVKFGLSEDRRWGDAIVVLKNRLLLIATIFGIPLTHKYWQD